MQTKNHLPQPRYYQTKAYAHQWFFLAACVYAILIVPLMMLARHDYGPAVLAMPTGHAFEMLFGFALALIAGYLLGPMPRWRLALLLFFWLLARISGLVVSGTPLVLIGNAVFALLLAWQILPRLWVAKKWRNRMLVPLLGLICFLIFFIALLNHFDYQMLQRYLLNESVLLFSLLMLYMGGRMLAPAIAGEFYRQGTELQARVQPRIEAGLIITVTTAFILAPVSASIAGIMLITSGILASIRLFRWQLWRCRSRPDLICLGIGYSWLALGLILLGLMKLNGSAYLSTAIHAITVGALGTLASNVIVRVSLLHCKQYPSCIKQILAITGSMAVAAILRLGADISVHREILLALSTVAWSTSFVIVLIILLGCQVKSLPRKSVRAAAPH